MELWPSLVVSTGFHEVAKVEPQVSTKLLQAVLIHSMQSIFNFQMNVFIVGKCGSNTTNSKSNIASFNINMFTNLNCLFHVNICENMVSLT